MPLFLAQPIIRRIVYGIPYTQLMQIEHLIQIKKSVYKNMHHTKSSLPKVVNIGLPNQSFRAFRTLKTFSTFNFSKTFLTFKMILQQLLKFYEACRGFNLYHIVILQNLLVLQIL